METKKKLTSKIRLILGGSKDNAAIGFRLDGPNGAPVHHAEFFTASAQETDEKGQLHSYDFGISLIEATNLANSDPRTKYDLELDLSFVKNNKGELVEEIFVSEGKHGTIHHKCVNAEYDAVKTYKMPEDWVHVYCLDDAKPAKDNTQSQATVDVAAAINQG